MKAYGESKHKKVTLDDAELYHHCLVLLQQGRNREAVDELWMLCADPFARVALTYYIPDKSIEDAIQDIFVKILKRGPSRWQSCADLKAYVWTVFRNLMNDRYKSYQATRAQEIVTSDDAKASLNQLQQQSSEEDGYLEPYCEDCVEKGWSAFQENNPIQWDAINQRIKMELSHSQLEEYMQNTYGIGGNREYYRQALKKCREYIKQYVEQFCAECLD